MIHCCVLPSKVSPQTICDGNQFDGQPSIINITSTPIVTVEHLTNEVPEQNEEENKTFIIGVSVPCAVIILMIVALIFYRFARTKRKTKQQNVPLLRSKDNSFYNIEGNNET